ncbi:hypothetical protein [Xanthomonas phage RTH11]|nr:hypothetical protein [Xanthomonas phage RTH11]
MKNTVFAALRSYQFSSEVESQRYFEALRLAVEVERNLDEPQIRMNRGASTVMGALDFAYIVAHYLVQPELELLPYRQRDSLVGLADYDTHREALGFKLATLLAPAGSKWTHYSRPDTFEVVAVARYFDRCEHFVVFRNVDRPEQIWMRTVDDFFDRVRIHNGVTDTWRFTRISDEVDPNTTEEQYAAQLTDLYAQSETIVIRELGSMSKKLFTGYLKSIGSKAKFRYANFYPRDTGSVELVYENDAGATTTLWVTPDKDDPNPGTTILFMLSQSVLPVRAVQNVLDRADFEVKGAVSVSNISDSDMHGVMGNVSDKFAKQLKPALGTVLSQLKYEADTGSFNLIIQVPADAATRLIFSHFDAVEENNFLTICRRWDQVRKSTKE